MTSYPILGSDHTGHAVADDFEALLAEQVAAATPVLAALEANGWRNLALDPGIDCEVPQRPDAIDVLAEVPAGQLGYLRVRARIVRGRAATLGDFHLVMGATQLYAGALAVLVADDVDVPGNARTYLGQGRVRHRTLADVGLAEL